MNAKDPKKEWRPKVTWNIYGGPWGGMYSTEYIDRPNERIAKITYIVEFYISDIKKCKLGESYEAIRESLPSYGCTTFPGIERTISDVIVLQIFCDGWQTGHGHLKMVSKPDPPYLENEQGIAEQVVDIFVAHNLTPYIDSLIRNQMPSIASSTSNLQLECDALGYKDDHQYGNAFDLVTYSYHPPLIQTVPVQNDRISVKLVSVRRLVARDEYGDPLYDAVEAADVEIYANYKHIYVSLPSMLEGDEVMVNAPTMLMPRTSDLKSLVVIANVHPQGINKPSLEDSAFLVFGANINFGSGMRRIVVKKSYWTDPETLDPVTVDDLGKPPIIPGTEKPVEHLVSGYELVFKIELLDSAYQQ